MPIVSELAVWAPQFMQKLQSLPMLRDVASDQQNQGLQTRLVIDRATASRLGISPQTLDDTLYDAFGQRQVSTMFTQLNQYHVVLETQPDFRKDPQELKPSLHSIELRVEPCHSSSFTHLETSSAPLTVNHQGQFPVVTAVVQSRARRFTGRCEWRPSNRVKQELELPASIQAGFQGTAQAFQASLVNEPLLDSGGSRDGLHRSRRTRTKATFTRSRFSRHCPQRESARCSR